MAEYVKRVMAADARKAVVAASGGQQWVEEHPALWEYLTLDTWEDGSSRETSMVCLFFEQDVFKVCLQDRAAGRSLWASGATPEGALRALEHFLSTGTGDWRNARYSGQRSQKRGK